MSFYPSPVPQTAEISDMLTREAGRIMPNEIQKRLSWTSIVIDQIDRGPFPNELGKVINVLTVERSVITDPNNNFAILSDDHAWSNVGSSTNGSNTGGACIPNVYRASYGQTLRSFQLVTDSLETDRICLNDLRTDFELNNQLSITFDSFSGAVREFLERHGMGEYLFNSANKIIVNGGGYGSLSSVPLGSMPSFAFAPNGGSPNTYVLDNTNGGVNTVVNSVPNSVLTQGFLDNVYLSMNREVIGDGAVGKKMSANIYALFTDSETSRSLIQSSTNNRQDWNFAWQGSRKEAPLLNPYGLEISYNNFAHVIIDHMPRYLFTPTVYGGAITAWTCSRVNYWQITTTTNGVQASVNPTYIGQGLATNIGGLTGANQLLAAVSWVFNPKVFKWLVPGPLNSPGGNTSFQTPDYFPATFSWKNILNEFTNPDGTIGYFRAVLQAGSMPMHPNYGWCFLHLVNTPSTALLANA